MLAANGVLIGGVAPVIGSRLPAGPITLSPISVSGSGDVYMSAGNNIRNGTSTGTAANPWPIFDFRTTVAGVRLVNLSPYALDIGGIDVVLAPSNTLPLVKLTPNGGNPTGFKTSATLQFDLRRTAGSSYLDLEQRSDTAQDLVISGPINNPLGLTRLVNLNGSITGSGLITTQQLDVYAPNGSVGTSVAPLQIDLVRYASQGPVGGPPLGTVVDPRVVVDAGGDAYLSLRGVDRATPAATSMTLYIDSITVGGLADLTLRTAAAQTVGTRSADVNAQVVQESSLWAAPRPHSSHFRGTNSTVRAEYDPGYTAGGTPDPTRPTGAGTSISTSVVFGLRNVVLPRVQVPGIGGDHYAAATAAGGGYTLFSAAAAPPETPGLRANGISISDTGVNAPAVTLTGAINPDLGQRIPYGLLGINVAGDITLVVFGNVRVEKITSRTGDIDMDYRGHVIDDENDAVIGARALLAAEPDGCDVTGRNITIRGREEFGRPDGFIEICLVDDQPTLGGLTVVVQRSAFINELTGDLRLKSVIVTAGDASLPNDLTLTTTDGSIVDFDNDAAADVEANRIVLVAGGTGSIGTAANPVEINSSTAGWRAGWVYAETPSALHLVETIGALLVLGALAGTGPVQLATVDTTAPDPGVDGRGVAYQAETIELILSGEIVVAQGVTLFAAPPSDPDGTALTGVWAFDGAVTIAAGDDVRAPADTYIYGAGGVAITIDAGNADPGRGAYGYFGGVIAADLFGFNAGGITVTGNADDDIVEFDQTYLLAPTVARGAAGDDLFTVTGLQTMEVQAGHTLTLDGEAGSDGYLVITTGSEGDPRNYVVNVLDTGTTGTDALVVHGTDESDDLFLLRTIESITGPLWGITPTGPAFVTLLPTGPADDEAALSLQRVNYDSRLEQLTVDGRAGDDSFLVDGTSAATALLGGAGADVFTLGQVYGSERDDTVVDMPTDIFPTTETTRGWVSAGPSRPLVALGGAGDDVFTVLANAAPVALSGGDDNDLFTVQAFALPAGGYLTHGQVLVDGGGGFNKAVGVGTELADSYGIDGLALVGAGTLMTAADISVLELDGLAGDDDFFVADTTAGVLTRVIGGLGSDVFTIVGDLTRPLVGADDIVIDPVTLVHSLSLLQGPLALEGGDCGADRSLPVAVLLPGETDVPLPPLPPTPPENQQIDLVDVHDDDFTQGRSGVLTATNLSWTTAAGADFAEPAFGEPAVVAPGITFGKVRVDPLGAYSSDPELSAIEVLIVRLGSGDDSLDVEGTPTGAPEDDGNPATSDAPATFGTSTVLHGGGNTIAAGVRGGDRILVTGAASGSRLVVYGDTTPTGDWYATSPIDLGQRPFGDAADRFLVSGATVFTAHGDDVIDAAGLQATAGALPVRFSAYGGAGDDRIAGSQDADVLAGGSGDDLISGNSGDDILLGDDGLAVDVLTGIISYATGTPTPPIIIPNPIPGLPPIVIELLPPTADPLLSGSDQLSGGAGNDLLVGDQALIGPDGWYSVEPANGVADEIDGGDGNDLLIGGNGSDALTAGTGDDVVIGDNGIIGPQLISTSQPADRRGRCHRRRSGQRHPARRNRLRRGVRWGRQRPDLRRLRSGQRDHRPHAAAVQRPDLRLRLDLAGSPAATDGGDADVMLGGDGDDVLIGGQGADRDLRRRRQRRHDRRVSTGPAALTAGTSHRRRRGQRLGDRRQRHHLRGRRAAFRHASGT